MLVNPLEIRDLSEFQLLSLDMREWYFTHLSCNRRPNICNIYVGELRSKNRNCHRTILTRVFLAVGNSRVYRLQRSKWVRVKDVKLAQGTLLYGEMVKERIVQRVPGASDYKKEIQRQSLHVIDALRLGNTSLADLPFTERSVQKPVTSVAIEDSFRFS